MTPQPGLPDLVFTANAGLVFGNRFFSSRFRHEVRARESPHFDAWFAAHGFTVEHLPEGMFFEGAGDALFCGATLFAGYRIRSDVQRPSVPRPACSSARCCRWNWSIPTSTISIPAFARWPPARRSTIPRRSTVTAACWRRTFPRLIAADEDEASASAATPWWSARRWW